MAFKFVEAFEQAARIWQTTDRLTRQRRRV